MQLGALARASALPRAGARDRSSCADAIIVFSNAAVACLSPSSSAMLLLLLLPLLTSEDNASP